MPRIRFVEKGAEGFLIIATRGPGREYADGTISIPQHLLDAVQHLLDEEGVRYEIVANTMAPLPQERSKVYGEYRAVGADRHREAGGDFVR
jgi:hypothetical protein